MVAKARAKVKAAEPIPDPAPETTPLAHSNVLGLAAVAAALSAVGMLPALQQYPRVVLGLNIAAAALFAVWKVVTHYNPAVAIFPAEKGK